MGHLESQKRLWERTAYATGVAGRATHHEVVAWQLCGRHGHERRPYPLKHLALGEAAAVESPGAEASMSNRQRCVALVGGARRRQGQDEFIVAGNAYLGNLVPELAAKSMPCGTQVITTAPRRGQGTTRKDYCVEDCNYLLDYYRLTSGKRLIFGGGVEHGARDPANIEAIIRPKNAQGVSPG